MALYGIIGEFNPEEDDWSQYCERLDHYLSANGVANAEKKRSILISVCGSHAYKIMRSLAAPEMPGTKTYDELKTLLKNHFNPAPSPIVQRFKFNSRFRHSGESVAMFVAELRRLSEHCAFTEGTLEDMIRDRLVCGINDDRMQRRLLAEAELNFKRAYELCIASEAANKDATEIKKSFSATNSSVQGSVQHMSQSKNKSKAMSSTTTKAESPPNVCFRCGGTHWAKDCKFIDAKCFSCNEVGHIAKKCRNKKATPSGKPKRKPRRKTQHKTYLLEEDGEVEPPVEYDLYHMSEPQSEPIYVNVLINNIKMEMELDTGASSSVISESVYNQMSTYVRWTASCSVRERRGQGRVSRSNSRFVIAGSQRRRP